MTRIARGFLVVLFALLAATPAAFAQAQRSYPQPELDQMLAPVALYPDALLSQILMAAAYPNEVADAARWTRANPGLQGDEAVRAAQNEDWDPSVKSLVAFPQVLQRMNENMDWTRSLGDAFIAQEPQVMDAVQQLRRRAEVAGNLQSSEQLRVEREGRTILLQPASPEIVYVPYYDPLVVYGPWWWPAYQPVVWAPWPGYVRPYWRGVSVGFWWGRPISLQANFFFGGFDWRERHVRVVNAGSYYYRPREFANRRRVDIRPAQMRQAVDRQPAQAQRAATVQVQPQPPLHVQPRAERREQWDHQQIEHREPRQVQQAPAARMQAQPEVRVHAQPRAQPEAPAPRHEQRPNIAEARSSQPPRAQHEERRAVRQAQHNEHVRKGGEHS